MEKKVVETVGIIKRHGLSPSRELTDYFGLPKVSDRAKLDFSLSLDERAPLVVKAFLTLSHKRIVSEKLTDLGRSHACGGRGSECMHYGPSTVHTLAQLLSVYAKSFEPKTAGAQDSSSTTEAPSEPSNAKVSHYSRRGMQEDCYPSSAFFTESCRSVPENPVTSPRSSDATCAGGRQDVLTGPHRHFDANRLSQMFLASIRTAKPASSLLRRSLSVLIESESCVWSP